MADIFGRQDQILAGGLASDAMFLDWPELNNITGGALGMLIQNVGLEYRQPVRRVFELGPGVVPIQLGDVDFSAGGTLPGDICDTPSSGLAFCTLRSQSTYYIAGRPEGRVQMQRIVGPRALSPCFYRIYGSPCGQNLMTISGKAGCNAGGTTAPLMTWTMYGVLLDMTNMGVNAQEAIFQEGLSAQFTALDLEVEGDEDPGCVGIE